MSGDIQLLVQGLKELQAAKFDTRADILASCHQTGRVLDLIYDLGTDKTVISDENKAIIGPLLESSIKSIEIDVKSSALKYRRRLDTEALRKRSALQFLIDDFGDFPTKTQGKKFSEYFSDINELIAILDDLISKWKGRQDPDDPSSDRDEADDLPDSHTWWKD
ncbi:uncharacterized protein LOC121730566 [Aricia agestis]|uniref:uncharacterized protein LOC121730566 n=1 Tax=Aricia agestis TaxID=91739 RepID=UPI001C20723C|nr:uncharacterized protein LOC121730566 [Aricia agestis]XP_041975607.1 uncharacterized protein LOC121730566 [Aricia agestis]